MKKTVPKKKKLYTSRALLLVVGIIINSIKLRRDNPDRSLMLLRGALRSAPDGLPGVSTYTIRAVLQEAGFSWPRTRSWCETGTSKRKRQNGEVVTVVDPDAEPKKS